MSQVLSAVYLILDIVQNAKHWDTFLSHVLSDSPTCKLWTHFPK